MNIANKISTFRILTTPFFITCLVYYSPDRDYLRYIALGIFILATLSDAVDGFIARRAKVKSKVGAVLDPLADKLLLISAFICLYLIDLNIKFPLWVTMTVITRDVIILLGAAVIHIVKHNVDIAPSRWGKITTTLQMISVMSVLFQWQYSFIIWSLAVLFTVISGMDYIRKGFNTLYVADNITNNS